MPVKAMFKDVSCWLYENYGEEIGWPSELNN